MRSPQSVHICDPALRTSLSAFQGDKRKKCYICRFCIQTPHYLYRSLCPPCGAFNLAGSEMSLPEHLDLKGSTALVTGGRINLGYHIALRLLRCGSSVTVSSRYPRDAAKIYHSEVDSDQWIDRLKSVGADFRAAKDAFRLVMVVRKLQSKWPDGTQPRKLNILVNNAAQTLTDPIQSESKAVNLGHFLRDDPVNGQLLVDGDRGYDVKVRGGMQLTWVAGLQEFGQLKIENSTMKQIGPERENPPHKGLRDETEEDPKTAKSSWGQAMDEIPYEDILTAHSVNAFVPFKHRIAMNTVGPGYMSAAPERYSEEGCPIGFEIGAARVLWPIAVGVKDGVPVWGRFLKHFGAAQVEVGLGRGNG